MQINDIVSEDHEFEALPLGSVVVDDTSTDADAPMIRVPGGYMWWCLIDKGPEVDHADEFDGHPHRIVYLPPEALGGRHRAPDSDQPLGGEKPFSPPYRLSALVTVVGVG